MSNDPDKIPNNSAATVVIGIALMIIIAAWGALSV